MSHTVVELSQCEMDERLEEFQNWLHTQPDLPQHLGNVQNNFPTKPKGAKSF